VIAMAHDEELAGADTGYWPDNDSPPQVAGGPTSIMPTPMHEATSLAWADDDVEDDPVTASWRAVFNYAAALLVCGLIAALATAAVAWFSGAR
jgi:hypothetical protein